MTTAYSSVRVLKQQAKRIATILKQAERGGPVPLLNDAFGAKIMAARSKPNVIFGVVMDDKVIKIEMPWATIRDTSERGISEYILNQMREARYAIN